MASTSSRPLSDLEKRIHQKCLSSTRHCMTNKEMVSAFPDADLRIAAINFLLAAHMLKLMKDDDGVITYKAAQLKEVKMKSEMQGDEAMILSRIEEAGNEGIWIKTIQKKTELPQAVVNRCLKSLEQKQLIKPIKSVKNATRKMYMLFHLEPSVEVTGGPWYTDHELDTEFIRLLCNACFNFISERSFPKPAPGLSERALFPVSHSHKYPSAKQIHSWLKKSGITETALEVEHVEMLLAVLIYDGRVEKLPAVGAGMWDMGVLDESSDDDRPKKKRKRGRNDSDNEKPKKKKKGKKQDSDDDEISEQDESPRKRKKSKKRSRVSEDSQSDSDSDVRSARKRRKKPKHPESYSESGSDNYRSSQHSKKTKDRPSSPPGFIDIGNGSVYRATRKGGDSMNGTAGTLWSQAPCAKCPQFEFCNDSGPVNANECVYYTNWLQQPIAGMSF